jgi:hypothetical protein
VICDKNVVFPLPVGPKIAKNLPEEIDPEIPSRTFLFLNECSLLVIIV